MTTHEKLARIERIFQEVLDQPQLRLTEEFSPADCPEWDSVATVQIILAAEAEFGVRVPTDAVGRVQTVQDLLRLLP